MKTKRLVKILFALVALLTCVALLFGCVSVNGSGNQGGGGDGSDVDGGNSGDNSSGGDSDKDTTKPGGDNPDGNEPGGDKPGGNEPGGDKPGGNEPGGDEPGGNEPGGDEPGGDVPGGDNPGGDEPGGNEPGGDEPGGNEPGGNEPGGDNPDGDVPGGDVPEVSTVTVKVVGGSLADGSSEGKFKVGDTVTLVASSSVGFKGWIRSDGERVCDTLTYSYTVDSDSISDTYRAVYVGAVSSFDDIAAGTVIGQNAQSSGGLSISHEQRTPMSAAVVVSDPHGDGNVLKYSKTDTKTGDTIIFTPEGGGSSCFVLEFDFCVEPTGCSVPIQINLGSCYRLQIHTLDGYVVIYDAKSNGSVKHFLGKITPFGDWVRIRVEYFPGDLTLAGQYAKVYFDGKLAAISQNSYSTSVSASYKRATFYSLIASNATFYLDNVSAYSTDDRFSDEGDDVLRYAHDDASDTDWDNRFMISEAILGKEVTSELQRLSDLFDDDVYIWLANLYDPDTGGFYYSNDGRDYDGFLADVESTGQAMSFIGATGLGSVKSLYTEEMVKKVVAWVQGMQSEEDGYFYHPQWGTDISTSRRGRDMGNAISILSRFGAKPLYPTALDRLSGGASSASLTLPLGFSRVVAVSRVSSVNTSSAAPHLKSEDAFIDYLDNLFATITAKNEKGEVVPNSYSIGHTISSQSSQIKAAGLADTCIEYLNAMQNQENGLWEEEKNYRTASGLMKISSAYNALGAEFPNADKAVRSAIDIATSERPLSAIVYVYNPLAALSFIFTNLKNYSTDENAMEIKEAAILEMRSRAVELISNTYEKLKKFKKADGSFSYNVSGAPALSQGEAVCFGANEGDVNGTALANGTVTGVFTALGVTRPDYYSKEDSEKFFNLVWSRQPIVKYKTNDLTVDFEQLEEGSDLPRFVTVSAESEGSGYSVGKDTVYGKSSSVLSLSSFKGKNDIISIKFPTNMKNATCYTSSYDIMITPKPTNSSAALVQIRFGKAYMLTLYYEKSGNRIRLTDASSTGAGNKTTNLGVYANAGEWFNLRVEYYVGDVDSVCILVYLNGNLCAVSDNYYGSKVDGQPMPTPATTCTGITYQSLNAAAVDIKLDNVRCTATTDTLPDINPASYNFDGIAEGKSPTGITSTVQSGGSAGVAVVNGKSLFRIISKSGAGDSTEVSPKVGVGSEKKYVFEAKMEYVRSNNTTVHQIFFGNNGNVPFAVDLVYKSGKIAIHERTSAGQGKAILSGIDSSSPFLLRIEYYPERGVAEITAEYGETTVSATSTAYYSESTKAKEFSSCRIYSLISANVELHIHDLGVYSVEGLKGK